MYISKVFLIIVVWSFIGNIEALPWQRKFDLNEYRGQSDSSHYWDTEFKRAYKRVCEDLEDYKDVLVNTLDKNISGKNHFPNEVRVYNCSQKNNYIAGGFVCKPVAREIKVLNLSTYQTVIVDVVVGCFAHKPGTT